MKPPLGIDTSALYRNQPSRRPEGWHSYKLPKDSLSRRELEVCQLLVEGKAVKEVAAQCGISPKTAECHTRNVYKKLGVRSRVELVRRFIEEPVVEVREAPRASEHVQIIQRLEMIEARLAEVALQLRPFGLRAG